MDVQLSIIQKNYEITVYLAYSLLTT